MSLIQYSRHAGKKPSARRATLCALLLCALCALCLPSCRDNGYAPEVTLSDTRPVGEGSVPAESYAAGESASDDSTHTAPDSAATLPGGADTAPAGVTSGRLTSDSGTSLSLILDWVRTPCGDTDTVTVVLRLTSYRLSVSERPGMGVLTVAGETVHFSTPTLDIQGNDAPTVTDLYTHTFTVPAGAPVSLSATWPFNGTYAGVDIGTLSLSGQA